MTLSDLIASARRRLTPHYGEREAQALVRVMMEGLKGYTTVDLVVKAQDSVSEYLQSKADTVVERLLADEPIQYIFSSARFYGRNLRVPPDVLIPRPETEELVDLIVRQNASRSDLRVLDIATGSGCIAIALARNLPFSVVDAIDISPKAIDVARDNAATLKARIAFQVADILTLTPPSEVYDIIVSNPPYIAESEKASMSPNVLLHEPAEALYVPDGDPLRFYHAISAYALKALKPGGSLYLEINPLFADTLASYLSKNGWTDVNLWRDIHARYRMASARRQN